MDRPKDVSPEPRIYFHEFDPALRRPASAPRRDGWLKEMLFHIAPQPDAVVESPELVDPGSHLTTTERNAIEKTMAAPPAQWLTIKGVELVRFDGGPIDGVFLEAYHKPTMDRLTVVARRVLQLARQEADRRNDCEIHPGDILLGLVKAKEGAASALLAVNGVGIRKIRELLDITCPVQDAPPEPDAIVEPPTPDKGATDHL